MGNIRAFDVVARLIPAALLCASVAAFIPGCSSDVEPFSDLGDDAIVDLVEPDVIPDVDPDSNSLDHGVGDATGDAEIHLDSIDDESLSDGTIQDSGIQDADVSPADGFVLFDLSDIGDINAIWGDANLSTWAVGNDGLVIVWRGGGFVHAPLPPVAVDFFGVCGAGDAVMVVGQAGTVLRYSDGVWQDMQAPVDRDLYAISCPTADECFAVGESGVIVHLFEGEWDVQDSGVAWDLFGVLSEVNGGTWVVGAFGSLFELAGTDWLSSQIAGTRSTMKAIYRAPDGSLFAVGTLGTIVRRPSGSTTWQQQISNDGYDPQRDLHALFGTSSSDVWAVGDSGAIVHWDGSYWKMATLSGLTNALADFRGIIGFGDGGILAAGLMSAAVYFDAETENWGDMPVGTSADLNGVWVERSSGSATEPSDSVVFVGEGGLILEYVDGRFGLVESGIDRSFAAIADGVAVGAGGVIVTVGPEGARTVNSVISSTVEDLVDIYADAEGWVIAGADGTVFSMEDGGVPAYVAQVSGRLTSVCRTSQGTFVGGDAGLVAVIDAESGGDGVFRDVVTFTQSTIRDMAPLPDGRILAVGDNGLMMACGRQKCDRVHEDPTAFLYGVAAFGSGDDSVACAVGWAGAVLCFDGVDAEPVVSGTYSVFSAVDGAGTDGGRLFIAGRNGTAAVFAPEGDR